MKLIISKNLNFPFMLTPTYKLLTRGVEVNITKTRWCDMVMVFEK